MSGIKISEIKQIPDSDVTNLDSFLILDKETGKTKRLTVQQFTLFTLANIFSEGGGGLLQDRGVVFISGSDFRSDNSRLVWDSDNNRLGINLSNPTVALDVAGAAKINGFAIGVDSVTTPKSLTYAVNSTISPGAGSVILGDTIMPGAGPDAVGNIGIGAYALQNNITGDYNIGIGYNAGKNITGTGNIIIGSYQGTAGDNNIVLSNGQDGVARLLIDSAGNVGIGTTSPGATLHIDRDATAGETAILAKGGDNNFKLYVYQTYLNSDSDTLAEIGLRYSNLSTRNASIRFHRGASSTGGFLSFTTNDNTERMRITSAGNVGVGTTEPASRLHISGSTGLTVNTVGNVWAVFGSDVVTSNYMAFRRPNSVASLGFLGSGGGGALTAGTSSDLAIRSEGSLYLAIGNNPRMVLNSAGNVGIGGIIPGELLDVRTSTATAGEGARIGEAKMGTWEGGASYAAFTHNSIHANSDSYALLQSSGGITYLNAAAGNPINFRINNLDKMILDSAGNVGIGTTSTGEKLEVNGNIKFTSNGQGIDFGAFAGGGSTSNLLDDYEEGTWTPIIDIGTAAPMTIVSGGGTYTKIGRLIFAKFTGVLQHPSTSVTNGDLAIRNFPFSSTSAAVETTTSNFFWSGGLSLDTSYDHVATYNTVGTEIRVYGKSNSTGQFSGFSVWNYTAASNAAFRFSIVYHV